MKRKSQAEEAYQAGLSHSSLLRSVAVTLFSITIGASAFAGSTEPTALGVPFDAPEATKSDVVKAILSDRSAGSVGRAFHEKRTSHSARCQQLFESLESGQGVWFVEPAFRRAWSDPAQDPFLGDPVSQCHSHDSTQSLEGFDEVTSFFSFGYDHFKFFNFPQSSGMQKTLSIGYGEDSIGGHYYLVDTAACAQVEIDMVGPSDYPRKDQCDYGNVSGLLGAGAEYYILNLRHYGNTCPDEKDGQIHGGYDLYITPIPHSLDQVTGAPRPCIFTH